MKKMKIDEKVSEEKKVWETKIDDLNNKYVERRVEVEKYGA